jgi:hypothetical protein
VINWKIKAGIDLIAVVDVIKKKFNFSLASCNKSPAIANCMEFHFTTLTTY